MPRSSVSEGIRHLQGESTSLPHLNLNLKPSVDPQSILSHASHSRGLLLPPATSLWRPSNFSTFQFIHIFYLVPSPCLRMLYTCTVFCLSTSNNHSQSNYMSHKTTALHQPTLFIFHLITYNHFTFIDYLSPTQLSFCIYFH